MSLPLRLVLEFLGRSAAWLAVLGAIGTVTALLVMVLARRPRSALWPGLLAGAIIGGLLGASLADRFGWAEPLIFSVWRRPVPLAWSAGGALLGATAAVLWQRRRSGPRPVGPSSEAPR